MQVEKLLGRKFGDDGTSDQPKAEDYLARVAQVEARNSAFVKVATANLGTAGAGTTG
jgi:hypothetical protein